MATAPVKSQPLHYFSLPHLKWGNKSHSPNHRFRRRESPSQTADIDGGSDSDKLATEQPQDGQTQEEHGQQDGEKVGCEEKLWNLRPRRGVIEMGVDTNITNVQRSQRLRGNNNGDGHGHGVGSGKEKLWISLSREEIEEDVYSMTGSRPSRRPKKRSKTVQKQLDNCFPGLYLVGLTADAFKVHDTSK